MKYCIIITISLFFSFCNVATAQDVWTQKANYPDRVSGAVGFSVGDKGYIGLGFNPVQTNAFREYNPLTNVWVTKSAFPGVHMGHAVGFTINDKGYIGTGLGGGSPVVFHNAFWQYNASNDTWTQKANFGGTPRSEATGFSLNGKGYIGTGWSQATGYKNDFWEYDPTNDQWIQKANFPGGPRNGAIGFSINGKGYLGLGYDASGNKNDLWEYDPTTNQWTQKANFPNARMRSVCFVIDNVCYLGTGNSSSGLLNDFWKYNATNDSWSPVANAGTTLRQLGVSFTINNKGYIGTGALNGAPYYNDFWEYSPDTGLGIPEREGQNASVFPNPFSNELTFELEGNEQMTLLIYDSYGRQIFDQAFTNTIKINTAELAGSIYFYELKGANGIVRRGKVIKEATR